ncbi:hypothetical protein BH23ACT12_BH23ACT12_23430 [soil metagenome]
MPVRISTLVASLLLLTLMAACRTDDPTVVESPAVTPTASSTAAAAKAAFIPGLSEANAAILDSCLAGQNSACDRAQEPERLNDGNFSRMNAACAEGNQDACLLMDRLVEAELRMHCAEGDELKCVSPSPSQG